MKKRILVGMLVVGLMVSSVALFVGKHIVFAGGSTTPSQTTVTATAQANDAETADSNVQEPSYVGSIKVTDTNAKDEASESAALQGLAKISQADAEKAALAKVPGTVVKTSIDNENGYLVYSVSVKDASSKMSDVKIDAGTGSVLTVEASDGTEEKGTEAKGEEVSKGIDADTVQEEVQSGN
ncbi:MAG: PepSY domain-containing protein [Caldisericaceae bacterium]